MLENLPQGHTSGNQQFLNCLSASSVTSLIPGAWIYGKRWEEHGSTRQKCWQEDCWADLASPVASTSPLHFYECSAGEVESLEWIKTDPREWPSQLKSCAFLTAWLQRRSIWGGALETTFVSSCVEWCWSHPLRNCLRRMSRFITSFSFYAVKRDSRRLWYPLG